MGDYKVDKATLKIGCGIDGTKGEEVSVFIPNIESLFDFSYEIEVETPVDKLLGKSKSTVSRALETINKLSGVKEAVKNDTDTTKVAKSAWHALPTFKGVKPLSFKNQIDFEFYFGMDGDFNKSEITGWKKIMKELAPTVSGGTIAPPVPQSSEVLATTILKLEDTSLTKETEGDTEDDEATNQDTTNLINGSLAKEAKALVNAFNEAVKATYTGNYNQIFCQITYKGLKTPVFFPKGVKVEFNTSERIKTGSGALYPIGATLSFTGCQTSELTTKGLIQSILSDNSYTFA